MRADLVIVNAALHTVDAVNPRAEALAIADGRIVAIGGDAEIRGLAGGATEEIDAGGATVLPGFVDAHNHVRLGSNPGAVQLAGASSLGEIRARIDAFADTHPDAVWIEGEGWNYTAIPGGAPTAAMLEGAGRGKALFLFSYDVHTVWLNRAMLLDQRGPGSDAMDGRLARTGPDSTSLRHRCAAPRKRASARWSPTSLGTRRIRSTAGWWRRSTWRPRSGSRRSSSHRTAWTTSPCSCGRAMRARFGPV
jgi:hypothetical protein